LAAEEAEEGARVEAVLLFVAEEVDGGAGMEAVLLLTVDGGAGARIEVLLLETELFEDILIL
jgi:hypothetical protein